MMKEVSFVVGVGWLMRTHLSAAPPASGVATTATLPPPFSTRVLPTVCTAAGGAPTVSASKVALKMVSTSQVAARQNTAPSGTVHANHVRRTRARAGNPLSLVMMVSPFHQSERRGPRIFAGKMTSAQRKP